MDERSRYFEYVAKVIGRARFKWVTLPRAILVILSLVGVIEWIIVKYYYSWLGATQDISEYMLKTTIEYFSNDTFWSLCLNNGFPEHKIYSLLFIYYSWNAFMLMVFFLILGEQFGSRKWEILQDEERAVFCKVMRLHKLLVNQFHESRRTVRRKAIRLVKSLDLYATISPLQKDWQKKPASRCLSIIH